MNRPSARTNFPDRPRARYRSRSPTATSPETRTCPIRVPCHHAHHPLKRRARLSCPPFNRARAHLLSSLDVRKSRRCLRSPLFSHSDPLFTSASIVLVLVVVLVLDPLPPPAQKRGPVHSASPAITPAIHSKAEQDYRAPIQSCSWSLSFSSSLDVSKSTRRCLRSRLFSHSDPLFAQQRSKLDNEHDDENDSGTVAMDEIDRITIVIYIHIKNMLL